MASVARSCCDLLAALDAMEPKRLIRDDLIKEGDVCALGAVGRVRGIEMENINPHDHVVVATTFNIAPALAAEIMWINDDEFHVTAERRFELVRAWVARQIKETV